MSITAPARDTMSTISSVTRIHHLGITVRDTVTSEAA